MTVGGTMSDTTFDEAPPLADDIDGGGRMGQAIKDTRA